MTRPYILPRAAPVVFLCGCMTIHAVGGSATPGEVYVAAQTSALGFPGRPFILRCQDRPEGDTNRIDCERILDGKDLRELTPRRDETESFPGSTLFTSSRLASPARPTTPDSQERASTSDPIGPFLDRAYSALAMGRPDERTVERDRAALRGLLRMGRSEQEILDGLVAARAKAGEAPVYTLAMTLLSSERNEPDFVDEEE